ncbi:unnamed protein product, partial [Candidula unifasciata]
ALPDSETEDDGTHAWNGKSSSTARHPPLFRRPPPYQPPRMNHLLGNLHMLPDPDLTHLHALMPDLANIVLDENQLKMLLDMSSRSSSQDSVLISSDKSSEASPHRSPVLTSESKLGRHIFEVTLKKEDPHGIGLTIVGGEATSSLDLGIFVKSVVPGGPADRDGRIKPGDRLIAIGTDSLEGKQHRDAVRMIREGGPQITLLVSQIRPPGTIKKRNLHDEQAEFEKKLRNSMLNNESSISKPDIVRLKTHVDSVDTMLRYDDFVDNVYSNSDNNNVYNSDEKTYPKMMPSASSTTATFPGLSSAKDKSSKPVQTRFKIKSKLQPTRITKPDTQQHVSSGYLDVEDGLNDAPHYTSSQYSSHPVKVIRKGQHQDIGLDGLGSGEKDNGQLNQLREEREIVFNCGSEAADSPSDEIMHGRESFSLNGLTEEEREHIKMLGGKQLCCRLLLSFMSWLLNRTIPTWVPGPRFRERKKRPPAPLKFDYLKVSFSKLECIYLRNEEPAICLQIS